MIDPAHRGPGYLRAALAVFEGVAASLGYEALALRVVHDNAVARALYRSAGCEETDVTMRKRFR